MENWKQITNELEVSNIGRIKFNGKLCEQSYNYDYAEVNITFKIHNLVAEKFIENNTTQFIVNHKDGDKLNNLVDNLEWIENPRNIPPRFVNVDTGKPCKSQHLLKKVICIDTNEVFESGKAVCRYFNISNSALSRCLKGYKDDVEGLKFEYYN